MKFSEMPYSRPEPENLKKRYGEILYSIENAQSAEEQTDAIRKYNELQGSVDTQCTLAYIRHTIDTKDPFYDEENDFIDQVLPELQTETQKIDRAILRSSFRPRLEKEYGTLFFKNLEIADRSFSPELVELVQRENQLESEYQKLYASAMVEFEGQRLPLPKLGPYKKSVDRKLRRNAFQAEGLFFDAHREELDRLFDELVRNRTEQGQRLGYDSYLPLAYDRLGRNCYGPEQVSAFREQVAEELVPMASAVKKAQAKRLGLDSLKFYDETLLFPDGNASPMGGPDDLLRAGRKMYRRLSPETGEFIDYLFDNELLDVLSREGKAPGGYCTEIYGYRSPFIFSNFNGTADDVDVLTHEAGHAFAAYRAMKKGYIPQLLLPTMEACECHSMSMEFLTRPGHDLFFGDAVGKYERGHCEDALVFLPYGCMVDEFQHGVYSEPGLNPEQRHELWMELERKYRPWTDFDGLPFYARGARWQRQLHIYLHPLYYIDYCFAQTVAFQFLLASMENRENAWERYLSFVDAGGTKTFEELVTDAGLKLPYAPGCAAEIAGKIQTLLFDTEASF